MLAEVALAAGLDVKKSEVHGMAQRGGSVNTHVRWDPERVHSPLIGLGRPTSCWSLSKPRHLRYAEYLKPGGWSSSTSIPLSPSPSPRAEPTTRPSTRCKQYIKAITDRSPPVPGTAIAQELGNARAANVVLIGALSTFLDVAEDTWLQVIEARVPPKYVDLNRQAFARGRQCVTS